MSTSGSPFLERAGLIPAHRNPQPRCSPRDLLIHQLPLTPPLPLPELQGYLEGEPSPPDRGVTQDWPFPEGNDDEDET